MRNICLINKKVAINRWAKRFALQDRIYKENSLKYPLLKARLLGYFAGDGSVCIHKDKKGGVHHTVRFYPDDKSMLNSFLFAFIRIYEKKPYVDLRKNHYCSTVASKPIALDLLQYGSLKTLEWSFPVFCDSKEKKKEWLRAFFDCEAHVNKKSIVIQSVNEKGIEQIRQCLEEFNIVSRTYKYERKQKNWNNNYLLFINRKEDKQRFLKEIGFTHHKKLEKLSAGVT